MPQALALSVITANHHDLIKQLLVNFRVNPLKAYQLVLTRKEVVSVQLEAWPFRDAKPRNRAGWMIQAIENNYDVPAAYLDHKNEQRVSASRRAAENKTRRCPLCNDNGFRYVSSAEYPNGAMRQCTHDPSVESLQGKISKHVPQASYACKATFFSE